MKNWFRKTPEKKTKDHAPGEGAEKEHNISTLYEIVEDHLRSLDYDQLKSISGDFAERFAAHQEIISEIVRTPPPGRKHDRVGPEETSAETDEFVVIDTRRRAPTAFRLDAPSEAYSEEMVLAHYDRMIRSQYDRLIDVTMDFLKGVTETEVRRLDSETAAVASDLRSLRDLLTDQIERLGEDLGETRELHRGLISALEDGIAEQNRRAALAAARIKILVYAVIGAGLVAGAALVVALIR